MQAATKWSQRRSAKARDPQVLCSWGLRHPRLAPPATPPPPGASPPPRGGGKLPGATEFGLGQPMRQRHFSLNVEERVTTETRIERSSPDGHRPQRPRAIVLLHVHLRLGREKQLDHLRLAVECCIVQRGPASVRSPACGCASGHLPLQSSVPSCWSRCLCYKLQGLFHSLHVWSDWPKSTSPIIVLPLAEKADSKPVECVQVLSSERKAIGNTWQNPVWRAWRKKMNITSLQCQETGDLLRQGREQRTGFQGWFAWKVSWKDSNCHIFCSYLN